MIPAGLAARDVKSEGRLGRWLNRFTQQAHPRLPGTSATLAGIAGETGDNAIAPAADPSSAPGNDMVNRQVLGRGLTAAILTAIAIPAKEVTARENDLRPVEPIAAMQYDDLRNSNPPAHSLEIGLAVGNDEVGPALEIIERIILRLDNPGQPLKEHGDGPSHRADLDGQPVFIQDQSWIGKTGFAHHFSEFTFLAGQRC